VGRCIHAVEVHRVTQRAVAGREGWEKTRLPGMHPVIASGNLYLRLSHSLGRMIPRLDRWRSRELSSFGVLHGTEYGSSPAGRYGVWTEHVPGRDLRALLAEGSLTRAVMRAAAGEFARAHARRDPETGSFWSHGAPHLGNVIYDGSADRARLIDFETEHDAGADPVARHADDLLVFLLDLVGRSPERSDWPSLASSFLTFYGGNPVRKRLVRRLSAEPQGLERVRWIQQAGYLDTRELARRLERLRWCYLT
jgi:Ser/Thr protein kinase RdoA (MazF antagonist)